MRPTVRTIGTTWRSYLGRLMNPWVQPHAHQEARLFGRVLDRDERDDLSRKVYLDMLFGQAEPAELEWYATLGRGEQGAVGRYLDRHPELQPSVAPTGASVPAPSSGEELLALALECGTPDGPTPSTS